MLPHVLLYRSELLSYSETFIASQAGALRSYAPVLMGLRRARRSLAATVPWLLLTEGDSMRERAWRYLFLRTGHAPAFLKRMRACDPILLHAHFALDAAEALPLVRALDVPLVVTLHGYDVMAGDQAHQQTRRGRLYLARRQQLWRETSLFLCVSEAIRQKAIERGYPAERLRVHAIGIDLAQYTPGPLRQQQPAILFVGRLVEKKGCIHLIRAMRLVQRELPAARLVVIGDGPERAALEAEARLSAPGTVFVGVQETAEVRRWMGQSRVLAVPSITARDGDAEGLPMVIGEALAMGLPVAAFRSSGIPELVRDGREGLLCEEGDEAGLARNLVRICQDDALAKQLSRSGRRRVEQCFALGAQAAELEAIYDEVCFAWSPTRTGERGSASSERRAADGARAGPSEHPSPELAQVSLEPLAQRDESCLAEGRRL